MAKRRLIRNRQFCSACSSFMFLSKNSKQKMKHLWTCKRPCHKTKSVFSDSYFEDLKIGILKYFRMLYMWSNKDLQSRIVRELSINKNTVSEFCKDIREVCGLRIEETSEQLGGYDADGRSIVVEIDETLWIRRKYNRGRRRNQVWVFGGIERDSGKCFLVVVPDRSKTTLLNIIREKFYRYYNND